MASYIAAVKGYVADVPRVWFKRCDGQVFYFDEITQANATPNTNFTEINAGWQNFPVAYLPGQSTMEISLTQGQFNADLFALANDRQFEKKAYNIFITEHPTIDATSHKAALTHTAAEGTVSIRGLEEDDSAAAGKFVVSDVTATETVPAHSEITFYSDEEGEIEISYEFTVADAEVIEVDNKSTAMGEAIFRWPVYGAAEDCTDSAIKGYIVMRVYRCRVTQMPKHNWAM